MRFSLLLLLVACMATAANAQTSSASVVASGSDNAATIDQSGESTNTATILQAGDNNAASQTQGTAVTDFIPPINFDATADQSGNGNTVTQDQTQLLGGLFGVTDGSATAVQSGDDNSSTQTMDNSGCCSPVGLADTQLTSDQSGDRNVSVQSSVIANTGGTTNTDASVFQTGDDNQAEQILEDVGVNKVASIDQSGTFNTAFQGLDSNVSGGDQTTSLIQSGDNNDATQLALITTGAVPTVIQNASGDQSGNSNVLYQELNLFVGSPFGNASHTATATQSGDDNDGTQVIGLLGASSPATASQSLEQSGDRNTSFQIQQSVQFGGGFSFSTASVTQTGDDNSATQTQDDLGVLEATITQAGSFNTATQYQDGESFEGDLDATISQAGTGNIATQDQRVDNRPGVALFVVHSADLLQDGEMNVSTQTQSGNGGHFSSVTQIGNENMFSITQSGAVGHSSTHAQLGDNNNTTIVQN